MMLFLRFKEEKGKGWIVECHSSSLPTKCPSTGPEDGPKTEGEGEEKGETP
jgi:hypothetical protein